MTLGSRRIGLLLLLGDLAFFTLALWLTLLLRSGQWPSSIIFFNHLKPFGWLFLVFTASFFIFDLYRARTLIFAQSVPWLVVQAQGLNSVIAVIAFYFIPYFSRVGVTPKTNLFIYLLVSSGLILLWRRFWARLVYRRRRTTIMFRCQGTEVEELKTAIRAKPESPLLVVEQNPAIMVVNRYEPQTDEQLAELYRLLFRGVQFVGVQDLYEEVFGRIPLGLVNERWFLEQISNRPTAVYDALKRLMDVAVGLSLGILSLIIYPLIIIAIKLEDGGAIFFRDERVGRHGRSLSLTKFRTMTAEPEISRRRVTRVGRWLRRARLDELPQLWSVVRGTQSLIGPRPERRDYVELYRTRIPFYDARHIIAPGLSGWAQIYHENHPHFNLAEDQTKEKMSYDLYYIKNRGFWLDLTIALQTVKILLSHKGI